MNITRTRSRIEQRVLATSMAATVAVAGLGVGFGALTGSFSILFDGVYALIDAAMSGLSLLVARAIARDALADAPDDDTEMPVRFQYGLWHFEPMVLAFNGMLLVLAALYALGNAGLLLASGGRELAFDWAIVYAVVVLAVCLGMAAWERGMNRLARSDFVRLDMRSWLMSGAITGALLVAFVLGHVIGGTQWAWLRPYIDPAVLALVCLAVLPVPAATVRDALRDIFMVAPEALDAEVRTAARAAVERHGFEGFRSYVARVGRARMIEIHLIAAPGSPPRPLETLDAIRDEIGEAIGGSGPNRWLTIAFTARPDWAH